MNKLIIKTGKEEDFFVRGRQLAVSADHGEPLPKERIISFEDPSNVMKLVTANRLALFRVIKETPGSITEIAERLHRDRRAVKRDIAAMEIAGLVTVVEKTLPGHGRMKEVRATADKISLRAELA